MQLDTGLGATFWIADTDMAAIQATEPHQPSRVSLDNGFALTVWLDADEDGRSDIEVLLVDHEDASDWDDVTDVEVTCDNGLVAMSDEMPHDCLPIVTTGGTYQVRIRHRVDPADDLETFGISAESRS